MKEELKIKITDRFSQAEIGRHLGCAQQTVSQWLNTRVPAERVIALCDLLRWEITPHEIRPDVHPTPGSGIPEGVILPSKQERNLNHENQTRAHP
ncbi:helix-turn-helix domain-containing protein [Pantoea agglomerans]|uniref:Helix-turn-helix domain-containing protein n=1 Tax=Enterobacter agglomerans TaxID=549 RepID=A0ACC5PVA6_ENTAG|nr:helix-turn-helix domain-containing protein [Pantoea agglomerans]MBD8153784.1 helix-turn-helix domain-containing protein [Pantoea agglomerans]MBD8157769.1 helix-turn-helix domain-containing protein [Pantoea agglomerans]MBD8231607.1 helix-turn-helix domain-containing protein [Pantoea agglomerans]MBD8241699.1 helix-turn-helix domain-containing protein [Pantoea agglomerans]